MSCFVQMGIIKRIQEDLSGRYRDPYPRDRWVVQLLLLALVSRALHGCWPAFRAPYAQTASDCSLSNCQRFHSSGSWHVLELTGISYCRGYGGGGYGGGRYDRGGYDRGGYDRCLPCPSPANEMSGDRICSMHVPMYC